MPIPKPHPNEDHDAFVSRCMGDSAMQEYPSQGDKGNQRYAICSQTWRDRQKEASAALDFLRRRP